MKPNRDYGDVSVQGDDIEVQQFDIAANASMFDLMIKDLYSRPIEAIVRELACNAYDAHARKGNTDTPFIVKLPQKDNALDDDRFYIRDFGTGIPPEKIHDTYARFGASDKHDTNAETGQFGIGAKAPLAYVNHFVVESFVDGLKRTYIVLRWGRYDGEANINIVGEEPKPGTPVISKLHEGPTDEPTGLKVGFNVDPDDIYRFKTATQKVLRPFDTTPTIKGASLDLSRDYTLTGDDWAYQKGGYLTANYVIVANVKYKLDKDRVSLPKNGLTLWCDPDKVAPAGDRESLLYDDTDIDHIVGKARKAVDEMTQQVWDYLEDADSYFDAMTRYARSHTELLDRTFVFEGRKVTSGYISVPMPEHGSIHLIEDGSREKQKMSYHYHPGKYDDFRVILADQSNGKYARCKYLSEQEDCTILLVDSQDDHDQARILHALLRTEFDAHVSQLDRRPRSGRSKPTSRAKAHWLKFRNRYASRKRKAWELSELPARGTYVVVHRYKWAMPGGELKEPHELRKLVDSLHKLGFQTPIYGVKRRYLDKLDEAWVSLKARIQQMADVFDLSDHRTYKAVQRHDYLGGFWGLKRSPGDIAHLKDPLAHAYLAKLTLSKPDGQNQVDRIISYLPPKEDHRDELNQMKATLKERYPLLRNRIHKTRATIQYINSVYEDYYEQD